MKIRTRYNKRAKKATLFTRKKSIAFFVFSIACLLIIIVSLLAFDNFRIVVRNEKLIVPTLPSEMEGYAVLHISDLHGQYFGTDHETLKQALASKKYNLVLVTGDLINSACDPADPQKQSVIDLFTYFAENNKPVYYVLGNHDEQRVYGAQSDAPAENEFYLRLAQTGAQFLDAPAQVPVGKGGNSIWLWPFELMSVDYNAAQTSLADELSEEKLTYSQSLQKKQYEALINAIDHTDIRDVTIALTHYPLTPARVEDIKNRIPDAANVLKRLNLVLAGHYHGGQIRLPLIGAIYVPAPDLGMNGFFPENSYVSGMMDVGGVKQNVSAGLGSMGISKLNLLRFRLFCTPEVSLITLTSTLELR